MKKTILSTVMNYDQGDGFAKILSLDHTYIQEPFPLVSQWDAIIDVYQQGLRIYNKKARHFKYAISWVSLHELRIFQLNEDISDDNVDTMLAQVPTENGVDLYVSSFYNGNSRAESRVEVTAFNNWGKWIDGSEFIDISSLNPIYCKSSKLNTLADYHNSIYRGKNLTDKYTIAELEDKISAGDFSDLYIGDFITASTTVNGVAESVDYVFAGFDYYLGIGNSGNGLTKHHAVMTTRDSFSTNIKMEDSSTTANGYYGSRAHGVASGTSTSVGISNINVDYDTFHSVEEEGGSYTFTFDGSKWGYGGDTYTASQLNSVFGITYSGTPSSSDTIVVSLTLGYLEPFRDGIYGVFGKEHCLPYRDFMTTSSTSGSWKTGRIELMNECMVYGTKMYANTSEGEKTKSSKLPLFQHSPESKIVHIAGSNSRSSYWLSSINSNSYFCYFGSWGNADYHGANNEHGVRPFFLLG